ncbi:MAG: hypothetical protein U0893_25260 [Chloroflexota bacterium]
MTPDDPSEERAESAGQPHAEDDTADERTESADDRAYATRLGDVLRQRSVPALRAFLEAQAERYGDERQIAAVRAQTDAEIELLLHRMILARADLRSLHAESAGWLAGPHMPGTGPSGPVGGARSAPRSGRPPGRPGRPPRRPGGRPPR